MGGDTLTDRALNRATLARQLLLERSTSDAGAAVSHLVGLQAQVPLDPYLALWSRLDGFDPVALGRRLEDRSLVRIVVMRGTIHLVTADDALILRPLTQPVLHAEIARHSEFAPLLDGVDLTPVLPFARSLLAERPRTTTQLRTSLGERFPDLHAGALAYACRCLLPLVQVPPRGVWGTTRQVTLAPLETWVGRPLDPAPSIDEVVIRYIGAFGPASVADVAAWSRLTGLREVVERLRGRLRTFRSEAGRELFDLDGAPRPDPDTPAPVRVLPQYDNLLLSHADRSRFRRDGDRQVTNAPGPFQGSVLVDGTVWGMWHVEDTAGTATLVVDHLPLTSTATASVEAEALAAVRFWRPGAAGADVRLRLIA